MKSTFSILTLMAAAVAMAAPAPEADANPGAQPGPGYLPPQLYGQQDWSYPPYGSDCNSCFNLNCFIPGLPAKPGCQWGCNPDFNPGCLPCYDDWVLVPRLRQSCANFPNSPGWRYVQQHPGIGGYGYGYPYNN